MAAVENSLPPEMRLLRDLLQMKSDEEAEALLRNRAVEITDALLEAMKTAAGDLRAQQQDTQADRMEKLRSVAEKQRALARFGAG